MSVPTGVLLTCHGSVADLGDLEPFLRNVRRGRPPPAELLEEVRRRYEHIGGSPLMRTSAEQAALLEQRLGLPCRIAGRLWAPYPAEVLGELVDLGVRRVVSLPLAPQSVHVYHADVRAAAERVSVEVLAVPPYGEEPALVDAFVETIDAALAELGGLSPAETAVILTAHSLPLRVLAGGDPYEQQFRAMASLVAARVAAAERTVTVAFQSQGATDDAWLGPDLGATLRRVADEGKRGVVVAPIGFLSDHVETLYDLDVEAAAQAKAAGLSRFARAPAVGTRARLVDALEAVVRRCLGGPHAAPST